MVLNQTSVRSAIPKAVEGQIAELRNTTVSSYVNSSLQRVTFTVTAANTSTTATINGTAYTEAAGGGETKAEIATSVASLIEAGESTLNATADGETVIVEAAAIGTTFTYAATANCTVVVNVGTPGTVPFGHFVALDINNPQRAHLPVVATDITGLEGLGFASFTNSNDNSLNGYAQADVMNVLEKGTMFVRCEDAVTAGSGVYVRYATGTASVLGAVRSDADTSTAALLPGAKFLESASAGELVKIVINKP